MSKLYKDSEDNVVRIISVKGQIPPGFTEVPAEEVEAEELTLARTKKMAEIRGRRDAMLLENDKQWLIASKKGDSLTDLEADAQALRDMPSDAQIALDAETDLDLIKAHDAFSGLSLTGTYE